MPTNQGEAQGQQIPSPVGQNAYCPNAENDTLSQPLLRIQTHPQPYTAQRGANTHGEGITNKPYQHTTPPRERMPRVRAPEQVESAVQSVSRHRKPGGLKQYRCRQFSQ